jgi:hypothetical protein
MSGVGLFEGKMDDADLADLRRAKLLLENPGLAMKLASLAGRPVEWGLARLPKPALDAIVGVSRRALEKALDAALRTLEGPRAAPSDWLHRIGVATTGAVGGAAGLAGLPFELPFSTVLMLRSVADHARAQGEDLASPEARMNCLTVFALGGTKPSDDAAEVGYFAVRAALARVVTEAAEYVAERVAAEVAADRAAPVLARLVARIATRFAPQVADKVAAQALPVVGALGGAAVNLLFVNHFQNMAAGHFTVRRLERRHGVEAVRLAYETIGAD